jgi:hypothetical protein
MTRSKILIVGTINSFCLETSYSSAAIALGYEVTRFDPSLEVTKHIKLGKVGRAIHSFLNVDAWIRKMNRELVVKIKNERPDVILLIGAGKIYFGTVATIKVILPTAKIAWIWPDTPMNLTTNNLSYGSLLDLTATYSKDTVPIFRSLGFKNVHWIPLAGDLALHSNDVPKSESFECDISFVGMWRPERERIMKVINDHFGNLKFEIHGVYWKRNCTDKKLLKKWKSEGFYAKELSHHFNKSRININIIDDTNYPAANMRFFEIPTSGGLQLCSACPELESEFKDKVDILYYSNEQDLIDKINWIMDNTKLVDQIRYSAQLKIKESHNYVSRLSKIISLLNN